MADSGPSCSAPFGGETIQFPVHFELRVIYVLALGATLEEDLLRLLQTRKASPGRPEALPAKGAKYGRMAVKVVFTDQESMHAAYADISALPCVKAVM
jgi:putative lipoic acid-binding regulatory protein